MAVSVRLEAMSADRFATWGAVSRSGFVDQQVASGSMPVQEARDYAEREFAKLLPAGPESPGHQLWCAYDGNVEVGTLWVGMTGQSAGVDAYVYDLSVSPDVRRRGYGRAIMAAGEHEARARGAASMRLNVFGHNTGAYRLYTGLGYVVAATSMSRRLEANRVPMHPGEPKLRLEPFGQADLDAYRARAEGEHSAENVDSATLSEAEAERKSTDDHTTLVAKDLSTPGQFLWAAYDGELEVGMIWLDIELKSDGWHALGHDIRVREELRRRGYARALLAAAEELCRDRDVVSVGLSVFGSNRVARSLFERAGFRVTAALMEKDL